jgi:hypothetical protein
MNHTKLKNKGQKGPKGPKGQARAEGQFQNPGSKLQSEAGEGQTESGNREVPEKREEVGLVELAPPIEGKALRVELVEVLERFGISVAGFDRLRSDSYEKQIAGRSLAELEQLYEVLVAPCSGYREMALLCPKWGKDHKPPHWMTLQRIKERLMLEGSVAERLRAKGLIQARKGGKGKRAKDQDEDEAAVYFAEAVEILSEELLSAKAKGKPISENLKVVDRLLRVAALRVRERRETREKAKLEWIQAGKPMVRPKPTGPVKPPETVDQMFERVYGRNPFKKEAEKTSVTAGPNVNNKDAKAQSGEEKIQKPEAKGQGNSNTQAPTTEQTVKEGGSKTDNHEIPEMGKEAGLVEFVPPVEVKGAEVAIRADDRQQTEVKGKEAKADTRPAWAKVAFGGMIEGPSPKYRAGVKRCLQTGLPVDVATGWYIHDPKLGWNGPTETRGPGVASGNPDEENIHIQY